MAVTREPVVLAAASWVVLEALRGRSGLRGRVVRWRPRAARVGLWGEAEAAGKVCWGVVAVAADPGDVDVAGGRVLLRLAEEHPGYCSPEHAEAARSRQTVEAKARREAEAHYERISRGKADPVTLLGWLTTTDGVVLEGHVVAELRTLLTQHRQAMAGHEQYLATNPNRIAANQAFRDLRRDIDARLIGALERLLPPSRPSG